MKDIYSPLEIDEEWDDMAPMAPDVNGPNMNTGSATAVAVKPEEMGTGMEQLGESSMSTLPPATEAASADTGSEEAVSSELPMPEVKSNVMPGAEMKPADVSTDTSTDTAVNETMASQNSAYDAAEMAIGEDVKSMPGADMASKDENTLNVSDTTSAPVVEAPASAVATAEVAVENENNKDNAKTESPAEPTPVKVDVQAAEAEAPAEGNTATTYTPEIEPAAGIREDMKPEPEEPTKEEKPAEEPKAEEPKVDLPVSPAEDTENDKEDMKGSSKPQAESISDKSNGEIAEIAKRVEAENQRAREAYQAIIDSANERIAKRATKIDELEAQNDSDQSMISEAREAMDKIPG